METRNRSIDAFRVIANWVVICVHTGPFMGAAFSPNVRYYGALLNHFVRVATPFFFLAAGYFFAVSLARGAMAVPHATRLIRRLMLFFVFWSIAYMLVPTKVHWRAPDATYWSAVRGMVSSSMHIGILLSGSRYHLWFLPALTCALALLAAACRLQKERALLVLAAALYLFGLIAGAYAPTPIGLDVGINTRDGPFFGTIFVASGFMIHRLGLRVTLRRAIGLMALGIALRIVELYWLGKYGVGPTKVEYLLGTYPFGVGVFMLLLTTKQLGEIHWMVAASRYSAGAYCAHALVVGLLYIWPPVVGSPLWEIALPFVALALTYALVMSLARIPILRPVVT